MLCGVIPPFLFLGVFIFLTVDAQGPVGGQGADACCPVITVNSDKVDTNLNGDYTLKKKQSSKPDEICINGCVYIQPKEPENEFCFIVDNEYKADVQCSAATSSSPTVKITNGGGTTTVATTEGPILKSTTPTSKLKSSTTPATIKSTSSAMSVKSTTVATSAKSTSNAAKASPTTSALSSKSTMSTTGTVMKQSS